MDRDAELAMVVRLRDGDAEGFDIVYEHYRPPLYRFLVRLSGRREVAEDLLQETWLRLARYADTLRPDTHLAAWLFTVARNLYVSYLRSRLLDSSRTADLTSIATVPAAEPSPFHHAVAGQLAERVERALAAMPLLYREALLLVGVEGFSPSEAAAVCGATPAAFRQRLARGRARLEVALSEWLVAKTADSGASHGG